MDNTNHIIEKVLIEVNTKNIETTNSIKNNISLFLKEQFFPKVEEVLALYNHENVLTRINRLSINFSFPESVDFSLKSSSILAGLKEQIALQVHKEIQNISIRNKSSEFHELSPQENLEQIFLFFLENGFYPWYGSQSLISEFVENKYWTKSFRNSEFIEKLKKITKQNGVFQRFTFQYPPKIVYTFLSRINSRIAENNSHIQEVIGLLQSRQIVNLLNSIFLVSTETEPGKVAVEIENILLQIAQENANVQRVFIHWILQATPDFIVNAPEFQVVLNKMLAVHQNQNQQNIQDKIELQTLIRTKDSIEELNGFGSISMENEINTEFFKSELQEIHVQNAGIILLHPFLKRFFSILKITGENDLILNKKIVEAVQILHFVATGEEEFWEGDLVFEKFICGVPLRFPLPKQNVLTETMKKEAEVLLKETIKNWPALKNTSPGGLQQMFLQREGKLVQKEERFKLIVERKAQDILLEKLNWNISFVKFPWKKEVLNVEW